MRKETGWGRVLGQEGVVAPGTKKGLESSSESLNRRVVHGEMRYELGQML